MGITMEAGRFLERREPEKREKWEKRFDEKNKEYIYFSIYRDLGPDKRSINAAYQAFRKRKDAAYNGRARVPGAWLDLAKKFLWEERAAAYDIHVWQQGQEEAVEERIRKVLEGAWQGLAKGVTGYFVEEWTDTIKNDTVIYQVKRKRWIQQSDKLIELVLKTLAAEFREANIEDETDENEFKLAQLFKEMVRATRKSA